MENNQSTNIRAENCLLRPSDVAAHLNISKSYVYRLMQSGEIPLVRIGKACRVRPQDLEEYIERNLEFGG